MPETRDEVGNREPAASDEACALPEGLPQIGELVGERYRIERLVGSGGMAHVLAARHVQLGHPVAVKVLDPSLGADSDAKERFSREARAMAALTSPHAVRVHDVGMLASGLPFMVMELLDGKDLSSVLAERGRLPIDEACAYVEQACEAVDEAHEAGLVHRDIKPQNLFLANVRGGRPIVRVLDFGIARAIGGRVGKLQTITRVGDVIGTLAYMAPEQIKSSRSVDQRADVWALGAVLYRLVTGRHPFVATPQPALVEAILTGAPMAMTALRPDVPVVLESVVMRCLRKAPEERFPSARSLRSALAEARAIMAVEPFTETTEPEHPPLAAGGRRPLSSRAIKAARERLRSPSDPGISLTARDLERRAPGPKHDTTAPMPKAGAVPTPAGAPIVPQRPPAARALAATRPSPAEHGHNAARPKPRGSMLAFVVLVVLVALVVVLGGLFVLASP